MLRNGNWGLILGGSSGMGLASAKKLARHGMNLFIVHRDRRGAMARIQEDFEAIRAQGVQLIAINADALTADSRQKILDQVIAECGQAHISVLLHSIAFGNLKPASLLGEEDFAQTIYNMGTSLMFWVQDIHKRGLFTPDARVIGLTSQGNQIAWQGYAAISAAKGALEAVSRSIAREYATHGIRCNILQPGITDTPALRLIPGNESMKEQAAERNPFSRLTTPEDVANAVYLMSLPEASWINGAVIRVDGGEAISN